MNVLIIVDMQNDFVDGALGAPEAVAIVPKVVEKIRNFDGIFAVTKDTHEEGYLETQEGKSLPVIHCVSMTTTGHFKKSQRGCCRVVKTDDGYNYVDGLTWAEAQDSNELRTVFKDGKLEKQFTLDEVRKNLHGEAF